MVASVPGGVLHSDVPAVLAPSQRGADIAGDRISARHLEHVFTLPEYEESRRAQTAQHSIGLGATDLIHFARVGLSDW
eukprot:scaffold121306_cov63-Phaeocystis_antarctica.AAC.1